MKDYEKIEQVKQLLKESNVPYAFCYEKENADNETVINGTVHQILKGAANIVSGVADDMVSDGVPKAVIEMHTIMYIKAGLAMTFEKEDTNGKS